MLNHILKICNFTLQIFFDMVITKASVKQLDHLVPLFDCYRQFYRQPTDIKRVQSFLKERLTKKIQ